MFGNKVRRNLPKHVCDDVQADRLMGAGAVEHSESAPNGAQSVALSPHQNLVQSQPNGFGGDR